MSITERAYPIGEWVARQLNSIKFHYKLCMTSELANAAALAALSTAPPGPSI